MVRVTVIKVGGSLLFNEEGELRTEYVRTLIPVLKELSGSRKLVVVVGGGRAARKYIGYGRELGLNEGSLDQIGILVSRLNAALLFSATYRAYPVVPATLDELRLLLASGLPIVFMGGLQPGQSTTTAAALAAEAFSGEFFIATDTDGVYDKDPKIFRDAKPLKKVYASDLLAMFGGHQRAGGYKLLDQLTLSIIQRSGLTVRVFKGDPAENIRRAVEGEDLGTLIVPA
uniref:UMP kinase n=1 Tax=Thermofilum pendens TaxID=2269 RepID=A0A7J3X5X8_THEPE